MGFLDFLSREESPEVTEEEKIIITGNNNLVSTEHTQQLQFISVGIGILCIILLSGIVLFLAKSCIKGYRKRQRQLAIANGL